MQKIQGCPEKRQNGGRTETGILKRKQFQYQNINSCSPLMNSKKETEEKDNERKEWIRERNEGKSYGNIF